tara:strand:+ start:23 stop:466 length:444 start_codon:yes stop_codon:yes gene_type:complete
MESPHNALSSSVSGSSFGAIFAINTARNFITITDQGDLLTVLIILFIVSVGMFVIMYAIWHFMQQSSLESWKTHKTFMISMYMFAKTIFQWVVMLAFSVFTQWLPLAFLTEPHIINYLLFVLLVFFAITFAMVVNNLIDTEVPRKKK